MARQIRRPLRLALSPIVESMGIDWVIEQLGAERIIEQLGPERIIEQLGPERIIDKLGGVKKLWAKLTPEQRRELKRLQEE